MKIFEELQARGLIAQVTDNDEIKNLINNGGARFYIGFDPTADSLHVGHFMALCLMKRLQMAGNKPVVLIGGGKIECGCSEIDGSLMQPFVGGSYFYDLPFPYTSGGRELTLKLKTGGSISIDK